MIDAHILGRRLRAARTLVGFDSPGPVAKAVQERTGLPMTERTLYALERGEQAITYAQVVALAIVLAPPGGTRFFWPAIEPELGRQLAALNAESESEAADRAATDAYLNARALSSDTRRKA